MKGLSKAWAGIERISVGSNDANDQLYLSLSTEGRTESNVPYI